MKLLKRIGIILLAVIVLLVVISFMLPSKIHVERSAAIGAPANVVFMQVNNLRNWNNWMPYNKIDPEMKIEYNGKEEGTGAGYSWSSENSQVGNGKITITESKPNELIVTALDFMENGNAKIIPNISIDKNLRIELPPTIRVSFAAISIKHQTY